MSSNPSGTTKPIAFRIANDVHAIVLRRATKQGKRVSEYIKDWVTYDVRRKR